MHPSGDGGGAHGQQGSLQQMVILDGSLSYKFSGVTGCFPKPPSNQPPKRVSHSLHSGQHSSSGLSEKGRIPIHSSQHVDETNHQSQDPKELVPINESPVRHLERGTYSLTKKDPVLTK